jgi:hypothetical protein
MNKTFVAAVLSGLFGGIAGAYWFALFGAPKLVPRAEAAAERVVTANRIVLTDTTGRPRAELAMSPDGGPGLFFYHTQGRNRLVLGLYSPAESEYPFVVLNDTHQAAAGIFRLFGAQETPVVVLKNKAADRAIFGLNPLSTDPFLIYYSTDRKKTELFGHF